MEFDECPFEQLSSFRNLQTALEQFTGIAAKLKG